MEGSRSAPSPNLSIKIEFFLDTAPYRGYFKLSTNFRFFFCLILFCCRSELMIGKIYWIFIGYFDGFRRQYAIWKGSLSLGREKFEGFEPGNQFFGFLEHFTDPSV